MDIIQTLLVSCVPAIVSAGISFLGAKAKFNAELDKLKVSNKHELEKLLEQHKVNIEAIREQHKLELEHKEKDHAHKLELMQIGHENEIIRKEKESESNAKNAALTSFMDNAMGSVFSTALQSDEMKDAINKKVSEALKGK